MGEDADAAAVVAVVEKPSPTMFEVDGMELIGVAVAEEPAGEDAEEEDGDDEAVTTFEFDRGVNGECTAGCGCERGSAGWGKVGKGDGREGRKLNGEVGRDDGVFVGDVGVDGGKGLFSTSEVVSAEDEDEEPEGASVDADVITASSSDLVPSSATFASSFSASSSWDVAASTFETAERK